MGMAAKTGFLCDQRLHEPQILLAINGFHGRAQLGVLLKGKQCPGLPLVRGVFRLKGDKACDVSLHIELLPAQFVNLADHVGRIDQGQLFAARGGHVPIG